MQAAAVESNQLFALPRTSFPTLCTQWFYCQDLHPTR